MDQKIRLCLVDDHELVRRGIASLVSTQEDMEVVGEAASGEEALQVCAACEPDVVLMDLQLPGMDGVEATRRLRSRQPDVRVLILTSSEREADLIAALEAGAQGYLVKDLAPELFFSYIRRACRGEIPISGSLTTQLMRGFRDRSAASRSRLPPTPKPGSHRSLTERELQVIRLVSKGATNEEIGQELNISANTVKNHLRNILAKLGLRNRAQAVTYALQHGLIPEEEDAEAHR
ncbi:MULTISPECIES: response regulator [Limnochorda]|uniref:response regulator n=1 Tax=Limnochorda TaxID=1676651 RepID=UPI0017FAD469|nr:response regulator transcription factor [Limnochorda pilosa]MBO2486728.1 DNA-binding response regulator [Bacillota bacterium]MBO2519836.1 DNA-binding response regulator [Bacillota bacterium]NMA71507.1 response regulator transcription factor [Bacillota bacterium]